MSESFKIAIVGSGPSGLSAAGRAAELGVPHVLLEAEQHPADTIFKYQKGKFVMAEPGVLPLRSTFSFAAGSRESILGKWDEEIAKHKINLRFGAQVTAIAGEKGSFTLTLANGATLTAEAVVLAIGLQGNLRKLGVAGEDLPFVQYQLDDPDAYEGETIVVVGAGDAAIENAVGLAKQNRVIMINRGSEFARCKEGNLNLILAAIKDGKLECRYSASATSVEKAPDGAAHAGVFNCKTPAGTEPIECNRIIARLGATPPRKLVESFGIKFPNADPAAVPELSSTYESNVPGMYVVGALGGYPLIKQAMNQGYEVVETIMGNKVVPADEDLLYEKFKGFALSVNQALRAIRKRVPLLSGITTLQLREFMLDSDVRMPAAGEVVFKRNDYTSSFYSIVAGDVTVEVPVDEDDESAGVRTLKLSAGDYFGELGLISGRRRAATVIAGEGCVLIETPRRSMLKLLASVESVRQQIDRAFLARAIRAYLSQDLPESELANLVEGSQFRKFGSGAPLFKEGDAADGLYLLRSGSVTVSRVLGGHEVVLSYVAAGNYVGEMALVNQAPRSATVRAAVDTEALVLDGLRFAQVLARLPDLRTEIEKTILERLRVNVNMETESGSGGLINYLVSIGGGEATDLLLIDESLCVRCNNCEKACADTHDGTSRLDREAGPTYAQVHVPTSCRHCEHPHCMKDCPPDAIRRAPDGEVFISDRCIGCGNCQRNCPYGVIQMAPAGVERHRPSLLKWLFTGMGDEPGIEKETHAHDHDEGGSHRKKAVKCDMCKDVKGGAACVRACPTGAAIRVRPEEFLGVVEHPQE
jgi:CRP-like cAMP-binding protein/Fe-S-cluster-containing hydrogenase component 2/thioredoxin reductase